MEIRNAKIISTHLGFEDRGIFTAFIHLDYGSSSQSFGGYALGGKSGYTGRVLEELLKTVGVTCWEGLPGKYVRVRADQSKVYAIGHITLGKWFDWEPTDEEVHSNNG